MNLHLNWHSLTLYSRTIAIARIEYRDHRWFIVMMLPDIDKSGIPWIHETKEASKQAAETLALRWFDTVGFGECNGDK